jgi:hypothetical protein
MFAITVVLLCITFSVSSEWRTLSQEWNMLIFMAIIINVRNITKLCPNVWNWSIRKPATMWLIAGKPTSIPNYWRLMVFSSSMTQQLSVEKGLLIIEASRSHSDTPHSVGLLWTSNQPEAEAFTWQHTTLTTDIDAFGETRTHNPGMRTAADPRLRPCGYWNRRLVISVGKYFRSSYLLNLIENFPNWCLKLFKETYVT